MSRRKHPTPQTLRCVVCGETLDFDDETKTSAGKLARLSGWSLSKHGWTCNWHIGAFSNDAANCLAAALEAHSHLRPRREYVFHETFRKWRLDFAFPRKRVAIEVEGAIWTNGRHTRGSGFVQDVMKYNALAMKGWLLLRYTPQMIESNPLHVISEILTTLEQAS